MNLNDTKSSETLRKEISRDLDRLDSKVDQLKERLSPGQIIDNAVFSPYRGNPRETFNYMKNNPVGTSFLALGTLLLMDNGGESYEQYLRTQGRTTYREYRDRMSRTKEELGHKVEDISQGVRNRTKQLVEQSERGIEKVRSRGRDLKDQIKTSSEQFKDRLSRKTEEAKDNVIDATESFRERSATTSTSSTYESGLESIESNLDSVESKARSNLNKVKNSISEFGRNTVDRMKETQMDSLAYVAMGGTIGFVTGGLIPITDEELQEVSVSFDFSNLRSELENAANESANVFKNELIETLKNSNIDLF